MKAVRVHETGGPDVLIYEDVPMQEPGPGEVRVKIKASGVNFIDTYHRNGQYEREMPFTPGMEAAGEVDAVGDGVSAVSRGDLVAYAMHIGSYAGYALVPASRLVKVPEEVDLETAAAVMLQGMTAHYLTNATYPIKDHDTVLIHAAAGGVGLLMVQIAKLRGATVIGTVSTEKKAALARAKGADEIILYTQRNFVDAVKEITDGEGVHVVYDGVGQSTFLKGLDCLRPRGYMVLYGQASGAVDPIDPQLLNRKGSLFLTRPSLAHHTLNQDETQMRATDLFVWISSGMLDIRIDRRFPLKEAPAAHRYIEGRRTKGKLLLIP